MKIRYHKIGSSHWSISKEFDPSGTPTGRKRMGRVVNGVIITGGQLLQNLNDYPIALPKVRPPRSHMAWAWVEVTMPDGFVVKRKRWTTVIDVSVEEYEAGMDEFKAVLRANLIVATELWFPVIPSGPDVIWQNEAGDVIPQIGNFNGPIWVADSTDLFHWYTELAATTAKPLLALTKRIYV